MKCISLADLAAAQPAIVRSLRLEFRIRERLAALGLRLGRRVEVVRRSGRAGPIQVRIGHTDVVLRAGEAASIDVEETR